MSVVLRLAESVPGARLLGLGSFQPDRVVTNDELAARVDTNDEWIRSRVGIESRRIADKDTLLVDMASDAGALAVKDSGLEPSDIGAVIVATCTMIDNIPNAAAQVAHRIGIPTPAAFDLNTACSGFAYGLAVASDLVRGGTVTPVGRWGVMVGAWADAAWEAVPVDLEPGDMLVLYTDGVTDARGAGVRFGEPRLREAVRSAADPSDAVARIGAALDAFEAGSRADDTAVLAIMRTGPGTP